MAAAVPPSAVAVCGNPLVNLQKEVNNFSEETVKEANKIADKLAEIIIEANEKLAAVKLSSDVQKGKSYNKPIKVDVYNGIIAAWSELIYKKGVINRICITLLGTVAKVSRAERNKIFQLRNRNAEFQSNFKEGSWHPLRGIKQRYKRQNNTSTIWGSKTAYMALAGLWDRGSRYLTTDPDIEDLTKLSNKEHRDEQLEALSLEVSNFRERTINNINEIEDAFKSLASVVRSDLQEVIEETDEQTSPLKKIDIKVYEELGNKWAGLIYQSEAIKEIYLVLRTIVNTTIGNFPKITSANIELEKVFENGCQNSLSDLMKRYESESEGGSEGLYSLVSSIFAKINKHLRPDPDIKIRAKLMGKDPTKEILILDEDDSEIEEEDDEKSPENEPTAEVPSAS